MILENFVFVDLDFSSLAHGFALLKMPRMPELRGKDFSDFVPSSINTDSIPYRDKNREKQRQKMLQERKEKQEVDGGRKHFARNKAWSKQKLRKEKKKKIALKRKHEEVNLISFCVILQAITVLFCCKIFEKLQPLEQVIPRFLVEVNSTPVTACHQQGKNCKCPLL